MRMMTMRPYSRLYLISDVTHHSLCGVTLFKVTWVQHCVANLYLVTKAMAMVPAYPVSLVNK